MDTSNITENSIGNIQKIDTTTERLPDRAKRKVKTNSIIFSTVRPNQRHYGIIKCQPKNFLVSTGFAVIDVKPEKVDANFLYYQLIREEFIKYLQSIAEQSTTAYPSIKPSDLSNLKIDLPSLETQKQIAAVLSGFDDKISLNKKINSSLEEMAKTIYLHNFFRKPTNAKISDILIENANSTISVGDAKESCGDFPFFTSGENILRWDEKIVDGRNIFLNTGGNVGIDFYVGDSAYSTDTWSITAENLADYLYLFLDTIKSEIGKKYFRGTALKHLQKDLLRSHKIYIPSATELDAFNRIIQPCFNKISENLRENYQLAKVRDWLLPLLMNGQVYLKNNYERS